MVLAILLLRESLCYAVQVKNGTISRTWNASGTVTQLESPDWWLIRSGFGSLYQVRLCAGGGTEQWTLCTTFILDL